jgi:dynein heavy chain 2
MVFGDLMKMNNMYQFSLQSFIKLFHKALESRPQAASTEAKLNILSNNLIKLSYSEIGRSLFKADRLTYSLHFIRGVFPQLFQKNEFEFLTGVSVAGGETRSRMPKWLAPDRKEIFSMFASTFPLLYQNLSLDNEQIWQEFASSDTPEKAFP